MNKAFNDFKMKNNLEVFYNSELENIEQKNNKMEEDNMGLARVQEERHLEIVNNIKVNNEILEVGIDAGNGNLKYAYNIVIKGKLKTKTGYIESNISLDSKAEDGNLTYINGVGYDFDTTEKVINKVVRAKDTKEHRGLLYKALIEIREETSKLREDGIGYTNFKVVFGCSIDSWNDDKGAKIKNVMTEDMTLKVGRTESKSYQLNIHDLAIQPECAVGIYGFNPVTTTNLKETDFLLVDIGNLNIGYVRYSKGLKRDKHFKINCNGMDTILTGMVEYLNEKDLKRRPITENQLKKYLLDEEKYKDERFVDRERIIQEFMDNYISNFLITASKNFNNELSSDYKLVFIGGGSIALDRYLSKAVEKVEDNEGYNYSTIDIKDKENLLFANAKAFLVRAKKLFAKKN